MFLQYSRIVKVIFFVLIIIIGAFIVKFGELFVALLLKWSLISQYHFLLRELFSYYQNFFKR